LHQRDIGMADRVLNVLFLCTGNSARSIMAEAILDKLGEGRFKAFSAGSRPKGEVHPLALHELARSGYATEGLSSKSWSVFARPEAPRMDFIFTVCANAAGETCPVWPGHPATAHWNIDDPAAVEGTPIEKQRAFAAAARELHDRIATFTRLPIGSMDKLAIEAAEGNWRTQGKSGGDR
jgi:protein-tyrosine-phosphatase